MDIDRLVKVCVELGLPYEGPYEMVSVSPKYYFQITLYCRQWVIGHSGLEYLLSLNDADLKSLLTNVKILVEGCTKSGILPDLWLDYANLLYMNTSERTVLSKQIPFDNLIGKTEMDVKDIILEVVAEKLFFST